MTASSEAIVLELFDKLEPRATGGRSKQSMIDDLVAMHHEVGCRYAEHVYMTISSDPEYVAATISEDDMGARLKAYRDALLSGASLVRETRNANDSATRYLAELRLLSAYFERYGVICMRTCLTPRGGHA